MRSTDTVIPRTTLLLALILTTVFGVAPGSAGAQTRSIYAPPDDLANPPADATKSPSGLISKVLTPGTGTDKTLPTDVVTVQYTGWVSDGTLHDSTYARNKPSTFPANRTALKGWTECLELMVVGEKRRCWLSEALAYNGASGKPKGPLVFDIELMDTHPNPTIPPENIKTPPKDARRTASGLIYKVLRPGTGTRNPGPRSKVLVHYTGWTTNGKMFDSSLQRGEPTTMGLDEVIKGWTEGMQLMVEGERTRFWIPQELAYKGSPDGPRGMLIFDVELIKIQ